MRRARPPISDGRAVQPQRVEIVVGFRTLLTVLAFAVLVALAILSLGTLLSIFLAAVIALGLDPVVSALVRRGWKRGRAALSVFGALFVAVVALVIVTAGPVWGRGGRLRARPARLLGRPPEDGLVSEPDEHRGRRRQDPQ